MVEFFKKKNIVRILATDIDYIEQKILTPYKNARPQWFKDTPLIAPKNEITPGHEINYKTFKGCGGIYEYLDDTFLLKWWADININYDDNMYDYHCSLGGKGFTDEKAGSHFESYKYYDHVPTKAFDKIVTKTSVKLQVPYFIETNVDNRMMLLNPFYEYNRDWEVVPGMYNAKLVPQLNVMIEPYSKEIKLDRGTGAMQLFFPDADDVIIEMATPKEIDNFNSAMNRILKYRTNRYRRVQKNG